MPSDNAIPPSWQGVLAPVLDTPEARRLGGFLRAEEAAGKTIHPPPGTRLAALDLTPLDAVKVVILGQDPYHGAGQAHGLSFSVQPGVKVPPSLVNIYKELETDLGLPRPAHGNLTGWARQGVLLLNAALTVEDGKPASHQGKGWEAITAQAISALVERGGPLVAILWGRQAQSLAPMLGDVPRIESAHPSPLSARSGFFGSRPFSRTNDLLAQQGAAPIDWRLT